MLRTIFLIVFLYVLVLVQASWGFVPNFVLMSVVLINLLEKYRDESGIVAAFLGGFFLDIFSGRFFGFWIIITLAPAIFIKYFLKNYFHFHVKAFRSG